MFRKQINVFQAFNLWFFNVLIIKWKLFEIVVYHTWVRLDFLQNYHYYTLQKFLIEKILQIKKTKT